MVQRVLGYEPRAVLLYVFFDFYNKLCEPCKADVPSFTGSLPLTLFIPTLSNIYGNNRMPSDTRLFPAAFPLNAGCLRPSMLTLSGLLQNHLDRSDFMSWKINR